MVYFVSDLHLSSFDNKAEKAREELFIRWLEEIRHSADKIFLLGDMMNFWFEYKNVIPRGYARFLGKLTELTAGGIEIHYFAGNRDMWTRDYLSRNIGLIVHHGIKEFEIASHRFLLGHGHELTKEILHKLIFKLYSSRIFYTLFAFLHPRIGIGCGNFISERNSKKAVSDAMEANRNEYQIDFCLRQLENRHYDYFVFGHTHLPCIRQLSANSTYVNIGDWTKHFSYAVFDGKKIHLKYYPNLLD